ncbi:OmpA family protein [Tenacibaculum sp.]|nr:OmpA family protein [Tenacibaculum sp.]
MSKKSSYLLGILVTIIVGTFLYWKLCCNVYYEKNTSIGDKEKKEEINSNVIIPEVKETTSLPFSIKDLNGDLSLKINNNFNFNKSNFKILDSVSENVNDGILKIKEYLDDNGQKRFKIIGYYTSSETNNSAFPNLGLARANSVKNYMVSKGIPSKIINTIGELNDDLAPDANDIFYGPLRFDILTKDITNSDDDKALKQTCQAIKDNPLILYFNTGQANINPTLEQRQKFAAICKCVDKLGVKIQVVGHTDNTGNADLNIILGQNRADFAKKYLVQNGILNNHIITSSKGQTDPIADNATDEGKAKNRRTVVTIN